jgi:hypothetical protein
VGQSWLPGALFQGRADLSKQSIHFIVQHLTGRNAGHARAILFDRLLSLLQFHFQFLPRGAVRLSESPSSANTRTEGLLFQLKLTNLLQLLLQESLSSFSRPKS